MQHVRCDQHARCGRHAVVRRPGGRDPGPGHTAWATRTEDRACRTPEVVGPRVYARAPGRSPVDAGSLAGVPSQTCTPRIECPGSACYMIDQVRRGMDAAGQPWLPLRVGRRALTLIRWRVGHRWTARWWSARRYRHGQVLVCFPCSRDRQVFQTPHGSTSELCSVATHG